MKNENKRKIRKGLLNSKKIVEVGIGGILSIVDPSGISSEIVKKGFDVVITKITDEFDTRQLTKLESDRVKDVMLTAVEKIGKKLSEGGVLRNDGFFKEEINDRNDAEEIFEAIIISSQREAQCMKLKFYANLLANIGFDNNINGDEAIQIIGLAERLSYRQCLLMTAIFMNTAQYRMMGNASILADRFITNGKEKTIPFNRISLYQDVLELYRMGLVYDCKRNIIINLGQINIHSLIIGGIGDNIVRLMELDKIMDNDYTTKHMTDFTDILNMIKNEKYKLVDKNHFVAE